VSSLDLSSLDLSFLPAVNAGLNTLAIVLLVSGFMFIRRRHIPAHRACMMAAFVVSALFLVTYLGHYAWRASQTGDVHTRYHGQGILRTAYYGMLISHIILAIFVPPLAMWMIRLGLKRRDATHRRVTRFGFPIWLYVSITGVIIYFMLYHFNPPAPV
jgi:uncharacterized membrane protein YozB (DUF420 family)